jgi:hypothetical protein
MRGLVPGIDVLLGQDVDGRDKPGHDVCFRLVEVADQIDAAADNEHSRHGPQNQDWHCVIHLSLTCRP